MLEYDNQSHDKQAGWIDESIKISGNKSGVIKSAKRMAKYIYKKYTEEPFLLEACSELKLTTTKRMGAVQLSAMFKAANVTSKGERRQIMRLGNNILIPNTSYIC